MAPTTALGTGGGLSRRKGIYIETQSHIIQLREITIYLAGECGAPQQPAPPLYVEGQQEESWADRTWRVWVKPFLWHLFWICFWFAVLVLSIKAGIYLITIGGLK